MPKVLARVAFVSKPVCLSEWLGLDRTAAGASPLKQTLVESLRSFSSRLSCGIERVGREERRGSSPHYAYHIHVLLQIVTLFSSKTRVVSDYVLTSHLFCIGEHRALIRVLISIICLGLEC